MSNQTKTATERNAFDIALQYATGIKIGADWREIALGIESGEIERREGDDRRYYNIAWMTACADVMFSIGSFGEVSMTGRFSMDGIDEDGVVVFSDGQVARMDDVDGAEHWSFETSSTHSIAMSAAQWRAAKDYDARLHRKPSWRERADHADFPPLVEGTVRGELRGSITVGDTDAEEGDGEGVE